MLLLQHKGFALVAFNNEDAVLAASAAVACIKGWGASAVVGPARKVPQHWPQDLTCECSGRSVSCCRS
jgi:hypothetical protein